MVDSSPAEDASNLRLNRRRAVILRWWLLAAVAIAGGSALAGVRREAAFGLAIALLADPDVLLLDEPYAGFDWDTYLRFWRLAAERRAAGRSVLVISHFVADRERFDRVIELRDGRTSGS